MAAVWLDVEDIVLDGRFSVDCSDFAVSLTQFSPFVDSLRKRPGVMLGSAQLRWESLRAQLSLRRHYLKFKRHALFVLWYSLPLCHSSTAPSRQ